MLLPKIKGAQQVIKQTTNKATYSKVEEEPAITKQTKVAKKTLDGLIKRCYRESKRMTHDIKLLDYELLLYNLQQNQFEEIAGRLKEVEYANPHILEQLYRYKERIEEQEEVEENEVVKDFREGKMDPAAEISKAENLRKKTKKNPSERIISNMISMRNLRAGVEYLKFT